MAGKDVSFMRMVFEATQSAIESKESSIEDMITGYKKGNAGAAATKKQQGDAAEATGGTIMGGGSKKSDDAMTTSQSLELQFEMGQYTQMATGGSNIVKSIKDMLSMILRNMQ